MGEGLRGRGGPLASGSDPWGTGLRPGYGNLRNYKLLAEAGFDPEEAVGIMTLNLIFLSGLGDDGERLRQMVRGQLGGS